MDTTKGTPKSLRQALFNAFEAEGLHTSAKMIDTLTAHIREFTAQKFVTKSRNPEVNDALIEVFKKIFPEGVSS